MMERNVGRPWTASEDALLRQAVATHGENDNWKTIAEFVPGRTNKACRKRWRHSLSPTVKKSAWTQEEDIILLQLYAKHSAKWSLIARQIPGRTDDACSKRYREALDPSLKKDEWTPEEDTILLELHQRFGGKWGQIGQDLTRSGLACRNRWRLLERKRTHTQSLSVPSATIGQSNLGASTSSVPESWPVLSEIDPFWHQYSPDPSPASLTAPLDEAESGDIDTGHRILSRSHTPPPFQFTSSSLSTALSTPRPRPRIPQVQALDTRSQPSDLVYEALNRSIQVDCSGNSQGSNSQTISAYHSVFLDQTATVVNIYNDTVDAFTSTDAFGHVYDERVMHVASGSQDQRSQEHGHPSSLSHDSQSLELDPGDIIMDDGNYPEGQGDPVVTTGNAGQSVHELPPSTLSPRQPVLHQDSDPMDDSRSSPHSSTPGPSSPFHSGSIALPQLVSDSSLLTMSASGDSPADVEPSASSSYYRDHTHPAPTTKPQAAKRKPDHLPKLDSELPVSSDPSVKAYACGHPCCWPPSTPTSSSKFATSHGLSEHCKSCHADMNVMAIGSGGNDQPFRCGLQGCGRGWKSLNGLQYHLQVSKAHFIKAISSNSRPPPARGVDSPNTFLPVPDTSTTTSSAGIETKHEKRREHRCPHPSCPNVYKQLSGLRYHLQHAHHHALPVQLSNVPPTLARKMKEKESKAKRRTSPSPDIDGDIQL